MLLPSALPCDIGAPPSQAVVHTPLPRSTRSATAPSPYHSPPVEEINRGIVSITTAGLMQTCRRLQQILSVNRLSPAPAPLPLPLGTVHSGVRKSARRIAAAPFSSSTPGLPRTPARRLNATGIAPPPRRTNKRTRSSAFPVAPLPSSPLSAESENSDNDFHNLFTTPPRTKRPRLTTPPPPPNRGPRRHQVDDTDDEEDTQMEWTDEDDRQLVEMVLGKLRLSRTDWEECAQSLGKDSRSVGKRWENLLGNISIKNRKKRMRRI